MTVHHDEIHDLGHPPRPAVGEKPAPATGPLVGIRVIELGSVVAGPFAGRLLADYGADVIKVEAPSQPDPMRTWGQESYRGHRLWWTTHARNKRCVTIDLRSAEGKKMFLDLVKTADVVVENFRPGTLERWGLGYEQLSQDHPGLILARISGYGQTGPYSSRPGYASAAEAMGGLRALNGDPGGPPPRMGISLGDSLAGMFAAQGILAALVLKQQTGIGQVVDVALTESCLALLESVIPEYDRLGRVRQPSGTRLDSIAPSNLFRTSDDVWLVVAANQDNVFRRLCEVMGQAELTEDPRYRDHEARGRHQDEIEEVVASWVVERTAEDCVRLLGEAGVVVAPVYTAADIVKDPQFRARDMLVQHYDERVDDWVLGPGIVPKFSGTPGAVRWAGPAAPGQHNREVFTEILALDDERICELEGRGIV